MNKQGKKRVDPGSQSQGNYLLTMLLSAATGAGLTVLIMSLRSGSDVHPASSPPPAARVQAMPDVTGLPAGEAAVVRGNAAYDEQRWTEAIQDYQRAIAGGMDTPDVRTDLGNALRFSGQPGKALEQYTIAQRLNPQHETSLLNEIGLFLEVLQEPARAIPLCEEFIRRFPTSEKLPVVRQQLARAKNPSALTPALDAETRSTLSRVLPEQPKSQP
jgi:tetratricopeptide (TPR) repeat protein